MKTAAARFSALSVARNSVLEKARQASRLTIPGLIPEPGQNEHYTPSQPYQSAGAHGLRSLSARLLSTLFPTSVQFFRLELDAFAAAQLQADKNNVDTLPNDFYGKSARTVRLVITSYETIQMGMGWNPQQYDRITFSVSVTPYLAPSSYSWGGDVFGTGSSATFTGPTYQPSGFTTQAFGNAYCSVVVGGRTYELMLDFQYTAGDAL